MQIGVLLIGSLFWDCRSHRRAWRDTRLDMSGSQPVRVSIRYGRLSGSRGCTYTMVFSTGLTEAEYGHGIVVPCKSHDLIEEAESLWTAETACGENSYFRLCHVRGSLRPDQEHSCRSVGVVWIWRSRGAAGPFVDAEQQHEPDYQQREHDGHADALRAR